MDIPKLEDCQAVSKAIRKQGPRVNGGIYKTLVPEWVDKKGNIHPDVVEKAVAEKTISNQPFDHPVNWERFYHPRLPELTPTSAVRVAQQLMLGRKPHPEDAAHFPEFVTPEGFIIAERLEQIPTPI